MSAAAAVVATTTAAAMTEGGKGDGGSGDCEDQQTQQQQQRRRQRDDADDESDTREDDAVVFFIVVVVDNDDNRVPLSMSLEAAVVVVDAAVLVVHILDERLTARRPAATLAVPSTSVLRPWRPLPISVRRPPLHAVVAATAATDGGGRARQIVAVHRHPRRPINLIAAMAFQYSSPFSSWRWRH